MKVKKSYMMVSIIVVTLILASIIFVVSTFKENIWGKNERLLKNKILFSLGSKERINLSEFTPFKWDIMYSFAPYTSKEKIYETVGYKWDTISETVSEGMNQIVFMNDGDVVCYLYGYSENNGYGFIITNYQEEIAKKIYSINKPNFNIKRYGKVIYLEYKD
ncbi:MAG: hypothetical protein FIA99_08180 [Ruminiclostridium sp.]|nr:hypothetical protein [Ruminiclostridium sp.]